MTPANLITSRTNARIKQLRAASAGNSRLSEGLVAIEGETMIQEAVRSGLELTTLFLSEDYARPDWLPGDVEALRVSGPVFSGATDTQTPKGIAALLEPPVWQLDEVLAEARAAGPLLLLVAGGLQDPGNLGTLVRSAEAFASTAVLTTPGTVSPWNPKALRGSAGSLFRVPTVGVSPAQLAALAHDGVRLLAAVAADSRAHDSKAHPRGTVPVSQLDLTADCAFLIGNEGRGLAPELLALADTIVSIPTPGPVESLNAAVAGSLLLYEAARQRAGAQGVS